MSVSNIKRLFDLPQYQLDHYPLERAFNTKVNGHWEGVSTKQFNEDINTISRALIKIGVQPKDNICIITHVNCYEWNVLDMALMQVGAVGVPLYPTLSEKDFHYILNHSESKYCFVSNQDLYNHISNIKNDTIVEKLYCFDSNVTELNFASLFKLGQSLEYSKELEQRKANITTDDLATIVYTSGTTGNPKGAMHSHKSMLFAAVTIAIDLLNLEPGDNDRVLSYLPINHIFERVANYYYMALGASIYYAESLETLADNFKEVKPTFIPIVPRLVEKIYDKILAKGNELSGIKKGLFFWAIDVANAYEEDKPMSFAYKLKHKIADKLIFSKWREIFGGEIKFILSGSAPLQPRLIKIFTVAGLKIYEGYGMTETAAVIAVNSRKVVHVDGSSGLPTPVEVKIADDGEILFKGENVFLGYYKAQDKTDEVLKDGYLHTEDIGMIDDQGILHITDRKKELFKTSGGKYIAPAVVENQLKQSSFIEQIVVVGEGKKMPTALIQVNYERVNDWAKEKGITIDNYANSVDLQTKIQRELDRYNPNLGKWEQVKKFKISPDEWTVEGGQLTPTLKAKRKVIKAMYGDLIKEMYK